MTRVKRFLISVGFAVVFMSAVGRCDRSREVIRLRDAVIVDHPTVWLSDLLSAGSSMALRTASASVVLCPAPQPGSMRVLDAEQIRIAMAARPDLFQRIAAPPSVIVQSKGWPIKQADIENAIAEYLRQRGTNASLFAMARVDLPEFLVATGKNFQLQVAQMRWLSRQLIEIRLHCSHHACLDFLAHIVLPERSAEQSRAALIRSVFPNSTQIPEPAPAGSTLMAKGTTAMLILEDARMRLSIPVTCLEAGQLNERIRVFDRRNRQVFLAEVVGDHLLRATL
jgi:hypothetical protein